MNKRIKKIFIFELIILIIIVSLFSLYKIIDYNRNTNHKGVFYINYSIESANKSNTLTLRYYADKNPNEESNYPYVLRLDILLNDKKLESLIEGVGETKENAVDNFADNIDTKEEYVYQTIKDTKTDNKYLIITIPSFYEDYMGYSSNPVIYDLYGNKLKEINGVYKEKDKRIMYYDQDEESLLNYNNIHPLGHPTHGIFKIKDNKVYYIDNINKDKLTGDMMTLSIKDGIPIIEKVKSIKLTKIY